MAIQEIPKDQWQEFLDTFSRLHQGWLADVQVTGNESSRRFEAKGLPFKGASYDDKGTDKNEVSIFMDQSPEDDITHVVSFPSHIRLEQTDNGVDQGLEVEANDGTTTVVRFRNPASPDVVDRM